MDSPRGEQEQRKCKGAREEGRCVVGKTQTFTSESEERRRKKKRKHKDTVVAACRGSSEGDDGALLDIIDQDTSSAGVGARDAGGERKNKKGHSTSFENAHLLSRKQAGKEAHVGERVSERERQTDAVPTWKSKEERKRMRQLARSQRKQDKKARQTSANSPTPKMTATECKMEWRKEKGAGSSRHSNTEENSSADEVAATCRAGEGGGAGGEKLQKKRKKEAKCKQGGFAGKGKEEEDVKKGEGKERQSVAAAARCGERDGEAREGEGREGGREGGKKGGREAEGRVGSMIEGGGRERQSAREVEEIEYPFAVTAEADHAESPLEAFRHLAPVLKRLSQALGKEPADLRIYDPYFCEGKMKTHLRSLGFPNVYNRKEDFYKVVKAGSVPAHDVVVTNPPYSLDHIPRILRWLVDNGKPWMLLVPNYVYMKEYYTPCLGARRARVMYLTPPGRYTYEAPKNVADACGKRRRSGERKTAPYMSFWYMDPHPSLTSEELLQWWVMEGLSSSSVEDTAGCSLCIGVKALPHRMRDGFDPLRKHLTKKEREKNRKKIAPDGRPLCKQCGQVHGCCKHTRLS